jgi:hypothetical protein
LEPILEGNIVDLSGRGEVLIAVIITAVPATILIVATISTATQELDGLCR